MFAVWFLKLLRSCLSLTWFAVSRFFIFVIGQLSSLLTAFVFLIEMILMKIYWWNMQIYWFLGLKSFFHINSPNSYGIQLFSVMCFFTNVVKIIIQYFKYFWVGFVKSFWAACLSFLRSLRIPSSNFIRRNVRFFICWPLLLISFDLAISIPFIVQITLCINAILRFLVFGNWNSLDLFWRFRLVSFFLDFLDRRLLIFFYFFFQFNFWF